jgi:hypothetical protein
MTSRLFDKNEMILGVRVMSSSCWQQRRKRVARGAECQAEAKAATHPLRGSCGLKIFKAFHRRVFITWLDAQGRE